MKRTAVAFAYQAVKASITSLNFPSTVLVPETCTGKIGFSVLNPAAPTEEDPSAVIATVSRMNRDDAHNVSF